MNEKEIAELRRRFKPEKSNITHIRGCYVNESGEMVSQFDQSIGLMTQDESEHFLSILKRTLSGTLGKNLMDIVFSTKQVIQGEEHKLLMALRNSALQDEEAVQAFFQRVRQSLTLEGNYLILLAHDRYDVPFRARDGEDQPDASGEVFNYILCSICPVRATRPALSYYAHENEFHSRQIDWLVAPPALGFLFPAFDDRSTNLYGTLYYSKDGADIHSSFVEAVFRTEPPMPAAAQRETFQTVLSDALEEECSLEVVQTVQQHLCAMMEEHKANHETGPLTVSKGAVRRVLESCGVSGERAAAFESGYDARFGGDAGLSPRNLVDPKRLEVSAPDVSVRVSAGRGGLVETRVINGVRYILIRADGDVEVNGVPVHIS